MVKQRDPQQIVFQCQAIFPMRVYTELHLVGERESTL